jgi:hypothetical protein
MSDLQRLMKGVHFSALKHRQQRRKDTEQTPYINHPISVANRLQLVGVTNVNILLTALLHDTIEDTATTYEEIEKEFGVEVANMVKECTDNKSLDKVTRKRLQISHAKEISAGARLVKMADKLDNSSGLATDPPAKWKKSEVDGCALWSYCVCKNLYFNEEINASNPSLVKPAQELENQLMSVFKHWEFQDLSEDQLTEGLNKYYTEINDSD